MYKTGARAIRKRASRAMEKAATGWQSRIVAASESRKRLPVNPNLNEF
jgi:hypothetical protein